MKLSPILDSNHDYDWVLQETRDISRKVSQNATSQRSEFFTVFGHYQIKWSLLHNQLKIFFGVLGAAGTVNVCVRFFALPYMPVRTNQKCEDACQMLTIPRILFN